MRPAISPDRGAWRGSASFRKVTGMSKGNAIALGMMSIAIIALAIWNVQLSGRLDGPAIDLSDAGEVGDRSGAVDAAKLRAWQERLETVEKKASMLKDDFDGYRQRTDGSLAKLSGIEAPAEIEAGGVAAAPLGDFERQVEAIIEQREERERQERRQEQATRMAGFMLRGVEATPEQQKKVGEIMMTYWDARQKSDRELRGREATREEIEAARNALEADRDLALQQTLDSAQYAKISETLGNWGRFNRGGGGDPRQGGNARRGGG